MGMRLQERGRAEAVSEIETERARLNGAAVSLLSSLVQTLVDRIGVLEGEVRRTQQMVQATRVRRPVRDDLGTILYVVDEVTPPVWAQVVEGSDS